MISHHRRIPRRNFTYVSGVSFFAYFFLFIFLLIVFCFFVQVYKYMIFVLNFVFWLFGGLLIGIGFYAFMV